MAVLVAAIFLLQIRKLPKPSQVQAAYKSSDRAISSRETSDSYSFSP